MESILDMEITVDMEAKHHTLYSTTVSRREKSVVGHMNCALIHFINNC